MKCLFEKGENGNVLFSFRVVSFTRAFVFDIISPQKNYDSSIWASQLIKNPDEWFYTDVFKVWPLQRSKLQSTLKAPQTPDWEQQTSGVLHS